MMGQADSRIGFVGVGRMGANMARRLRDQGETIVAVYDLALAKATDLASELGCEATASPARVAELANIVFTVVSDDAAMRQIFSTVGTEPSPLRQRPAFRELRHPLADCARQR